MKVVGLNRKTSSLNTISNNKSSYILRMLLQHFRAKCKLPTRNSEEPTGITLPVIAHETPKPLIIPVIAEHGFTMMVGEEDSQLVNIGK